jgi:hypothetical protein
MASEKSTGGKHDGVIRIGREPKPAVQPLLAHSLTEKRSSSRHPSDNGKHNERLYAQARVECKEEEVDDMDVVTQQGYVSPAVLNRLQASPPAALVSASSVPQRTLELDDAPVQETSMDKSAVTALVSPSRSPTSARVTSSPARSPLLPEGSVPAAPIGPGTQDANPEQVNPLVSSSPAKPVSREELTITGSPRSKHSHSHSHRHRHHRKNSRNRSRSRRDQPAVIADADNTLAAAQDSFSSSSSYSDDTGASESGRNRSRASGHNRSSRRGHSRYGVFVALPLHLSRPNS